MDATATAPAIVKPDAGRKDHQTSTGNGEPWPLSRLELEKCARIRGEIMRAGAHPRETHRTVEQALRVLPRETAYLGYYQVGQELHRYLVLDGKLHSAPPLPLSSLDPWLIEARDRLEFGLLGRPIERGQRRLGRTRMVGPRGLGRLGTLLKRLYSLLLGDLEQALDGARSLVVSPAGLTNVVPFHALISHRHDRFIAERIQVTYAPCALLLRPPGQIKHVSAFFPEYGQGSAAAASRGALAEAHSLRQHWVDVRFFGYAPAGLRSHAPASTRELLLTLRRRADLVHFAGHGLTALDDDTPPELIFPRGQRSLSVTDLGPETLMAPLVVLASCTTAHSARFRDGTRKMTRVSLVEALLAAGVGGVVGASWAVKDLQSARSLGVFYQHLRSGSASNAMTAAYRASLSRLSPPDPRYWAPYALYGSW
jgi:hypothetical protein